MARDGTTFCNFKSRGSSPSYSEHGLCRQTGSHNGGAIAPRRGMEPAAILSATNGTTRGECFQPPLQATRAWQAKQADIGGLRKQWEEEWRAELEKERRERDLEVKQLKEEVRSGNQDRESLEREIEIGKEWQEDLKRYGEEMNELWEEACKSGEEARREKWEKIAELREHQNKEKELQDELRMLREERTTAEKETLRNHTVQIEQLEAKARLECVEMRKELEKKASSYRNTKI